MSDVSFTAQDIADFLLANPEFFQDHADLFANLRVPHPHETRAISLGERQILTLRTRAKDLEWKLAGLMHNATSNEKISTALNTWCRHMLAEPDATVLPAHMVRGLSDLFDLPTIALRLWNLPGLVDSEFTQDVTESARQYAQALTRPYCGPLDGQEAAAWLGSVPASLAIVALRPDASHDTLGLLVLGSDDPDRFTPDMSTDFLQIINGLASASLLRLKALP
ncbi:MAG TPA: DUF484 family protein [Burkholderiaceae bacterium]|nr:DUF484 family protein [Burkholderiaceae bacterium]